MYIPTPREYWHSLTMIDRFRDGGVFPRAVERSEEYHAERRRSK